MTALSLVSRAVAAPLLGALWLYRRTLGLLLPDRCRFEPTCSLYARQAIQLNGPFVGVVQALWRVLRCGPWTAGGIDEPREWPGHRDHTLHTPASR